MWIKRILTMKKVLFLVMSFLFIAYFPCESFAIEYTVRFPFLGVQHQLDKSLNKVVVNRILPTSNVYKAGLRARDVIIAINTSGIVSDDQLKNVVYDLTPAEKVRLTLQRNGESKTIEFILESKEFKAYYNDTLGKHDFDRKDDIGIITHDITGSGLSQFRQYLRNYMKLLSKVEKGESDSTDAAFAAISGFYKMYDKGKKSKTSTDTDIYVLVSYLFYKSLNDIMSKMSNDFKKSKIRDSDQFLVAFADNLYKYYYSPNFSDIPDIKQQTANLNYLKTALAKVEDQ